MIILQLILAIFMTVGVFDGAPSPVQGGDVPYAYAAGFFTGITIAQAITTGIRKLLNDE